MPRPVEEGLVEVGALKGRHAAVLASLAVEDEVDGDDGASEDGTAIEKALSEVSRGGRVGERRGLLIVATEAGLKGVSESCS
jgi:hypothetical protein